jgi:ABC-type Na+ efflux pump permease subunit
MKEDNAMTAGKTRTLAGTAPWALAAIMASAAGYLALLGWHAEKTLDPATDNETGPYEAWQVIALAVAIGVIAAIMGNATRALLAIGTIPLTLTLMFAVDAATASNADGLWAIGALLVLIGSAAGVAVVSLLFQRYVWRDRNSRSGNQPLSTAPRTDRCAGFPRRR